MNGISALFLSGFLLLAALVIGIQNVFVLRQGLKREHVGPVFCGGADALLIAAGVAGLGAFLAAILQMTLLLSRAASLLTRNFA
ncbi:hypothetical protein [Sphingomonas sp. IW22]|uniref:hypothetical protein n=1 Tax=Sphingomonas sp. IW22 TaxID=3242489 RepID=UPI00351FA6BB